MITHNQIQEICGIIIKEYHPEKIILFGSYAKGLVHQNSDLDLLIIGDKEKDKSRWKRGLQLRLILSKYTFSKDLLFFTKEEIDKWINIPMSFIYTVFQEGKVLYEQK